MNVQTETAQQSVATVAPPAARSAGARVLRLATRRPELGVGVAAFAVWLLFAIVSGGSGFLSHIGTVDYLQVAAELGILVTAVNLLMIAGEFDLSVGSMIGLSGIVLGLLTVNVGLPLWAALLATFAGAGLIGLVNGLLVTKVKIPSLIVTLAMLFVLRGIAIVMTRAVTDSTQISNVREALGGNPLGAKTGGGLLVHLLTGKVAGLPASVFWWAGLTFLALVLLELTPAGNWILGSGGDKEAARKVGVPVDRIKVVLFVSVALLATLVATIGVLNADTADVGRGEGVEFQAATAVVIGGTLITGGHGTAIGAALGTFLFAVVNQGFFFTNIDGDWFQVFLGVMLITATIVNQTVLARAARRR